MIRILSLFALGVTLAGLPGCGGSDKGVATPPKEEMPLIGDPTAAGAGGDVAKPALPKETAK